MQARLYCGSGRCGYWANYRDDDDASFERADAAIVNHRRSGFCVGQQVLDMLTRNAPERVAAFHRKWGR